jgi:hypothetical protein
MLLIFGILITAIAVLILPRIRVPGGGRQAHLGWMSEQWIAEYRASHRA